MARYKALKVNFLCKFLMILLHVISTPQPEMSECNDHGEGATSVALSKVKPFLGS